MISVLLLGVVDIGKIKERTWLGRFLIGLDRRSLRVLQACCT